MCNRSVAGCVAEIREAQVSDYQNDIIGFLFLVTLLHMKGGKVRGVERKLADGRRE